MAIRIDEVCERFVAGETGRAGTLTSDGSTLWSYDYVLAWYHNDKDTIVVNNGLTGRILSTNPLGLVHREYDAAFSPTTSRHRRELAHAMSIAGFDYAGGGPALDTERYQR